MLILKSSICYLYI